MSIQTNSVAIDIFRSLFNISAIDALEDVLSRYIGYSDEEVSYILTSFAASDHTAARALAFHAIRYTPLHYAVQFSSSRVESLLAEDSHIVNLETPLEPALAYAAVRGEADPIELLIDDGANVNKKEKLGRTALHWACYYRRYYSLLELLQHAEGKIHWDVRTPEGHNALDLFEMGMSEGYASDLTSTQIGHFRSSIVSCMGPSKLYAYNDKPLHIPGAFPSKF